MSKPDPHPLIEPFLDALWLEQGLSDNTVSSYRSDLEKFSLWLDEQGSSLLLAGMDEIQHYLAWRVDHQFAASSTPVFSRPCAVSISISTVRSCAAMIRPCCWRGPSCRKNSPPI